MGLLEWFKRSSAREDARPDESRLQTLQRDLDAWGLTHDETEVEREMLDALSVLLELTKMVSLGRLPAVATGHRIVGTEVCHFSAICSLPDEPGQPSGRTLFTARRAIFVGGARAVTPPIAVDGRVYNQRHVRHPVCIDRNRVRHRPSPGHRSRPGRRPPHRCGLQPRLG